MIGVTTRYGGNLRATPLLSCLRIPTHPCITGLGPNQTIEEEDVGRETAVARGLKHKLTQQSPVPDRKHIVDGPSLLSVLLVEFQAPGAVRRQYVAARGADDAQPVRQRSVGVEAICCGFPLHLSCFEIAACDLPWALSGCLARDEDFPIAGNDAVGRQPVVSISDEFMPPELLMCLLIEHGHLTAGIEEYQVAVCVKKIGGTGRARYAGQLIPGRGFELM